MFIYESPFIVTILSDNMCVYLRISFHYKHFPTILQNIFEKQNISKTATRVTKEV